MSWTRKLEGLQTHGHLFTAGLLRMQVRSPLQHCHMVNCMENAITAEAIKHHELFDDRSSSSNGQHAGAAGT
jgi:hypothetical protein